MIRVIATDNGLTAQVNAAAPIVYLDHCALRHFASHGQRRRRLLTVLTARGTVALSWMSVIDLLGNDEGPSVEELLVLFAEIGHAYCLTESDPHKVSRIASERRDPEREASLAERLTQDVLRDAGLPEGPLRLDDFLHVTRRARAETAANVQTFKTRIAAALARFRQSYAAEPRPHRPTPPHSPAAGAWSWLVTRVAQQSFEISGNDAIDLYHAAIPLALYDLVVLDGRWAGLACSVPSPPRHAAVFSMRSDGIDRFLAALEAWAPPPEVK